MRSLICVLAVLCTTLQLSAHNSSPSQNSPQASDVVREQLRGLEFVNVTVWVDHLNITNHAASEKKIEESAKKMLRKAGISLGNHQGAWLSIDIVAFPVDLQDYLIVQVWTKLSEEAVLKRAPTLGNPHGYITWDTDWAELVRKEDIEAFVLKETKDQLDEFCLDWETARDWSSNHRSPGDPSLGTLAVKGDAVIFLTLTQAELDSLEPERHEQANEVLSDFYADANRAIAVFREHGFSPIYSDAKKMTFQSNGGKEEKLSFDISQHIVAMALFRPGKKPEIAYGIVSLDVMLQKASAYFGIAFR